VSHDAAISIDPEVLARVEARAADFLESLTPEERDALPFLFAQSPDAVWPVEQTPAREPTLPGAPSQHQRDGS
jgi:hypothetical protein